MTEFFAGLAIGILTPWTLAFFLFWGFFLLVSIVSIGLFESYFWTAALLIIAVVLSVGTDMVNPIDWLWNNPWLALTYAGSYIMLGTAWIAFKWVRYVGKVTPYRRQIIKNFLEKAYTTHTEPEFLAWKAELKAKGFAQATSDLLRDYELELNNRLGMKYLDGMSRSRMDLGTAAAPPIWSDRTAEFAPSFIFWPLDCVAYVFSDILRDVWEWVSNLVSGLFNKYAVWRMGGPIE